MFPCWCCCTAPASKMLPCWCCCCCCFLTAPATHALQMLSCWCCCSKKWLKKKKAPGVAKKFWRKKNSSVADLTPSQKYVYRIIYAYMDASRLPGWEVGGWKEQTHDLPWGDPFLCLFSDPYYRRMAIFSFWNLQNAFKEKMQID